MLAGHELVELYIHLTLYSFVLGFLGAKVLLGESDTKIAIQSGILWAVGLPALIFSIAAFLLLIINVTPIETL